MARVIGVGIETADMLVHEVLSRNMRDRRAVARYAGLTGSPDESGRKRREKGLARSGNGRVRRGMIQLAWRFLMHQKDSALAQWFRARTENARGTRKPLIVALARKLLIAEDCWQGRKPRRRSERNRPDRIHQIAQQRETAPHRSDVMTNEQQAAFCIPPPQTSDKHGYRRQSAETVRH